MSINLKQKNFALPIIDLAELEQAENQSEFYENLRQISRDSGFFYLLGHGFSTSDFEQIQQASLDFFALPAAEKQAIAMSNSPHFRGYSSAGTEYTQQQPDHREQIDIGAELSALSLAQDDPAFYRLQGPNQWPITLTSFKPSVLTYQNKARNLTISLLRHFLIALDQAPDALDALITDLHPAHLLKLIHYPAAHEEHDRQGVGAHKDSGILSLLLQDDVGGLQVKTAEGWKDIPYLENAFIVIIGETLELATNGYLHGNTHRVLSPQKNVDRYSIAYFLTPNIFSGDIPLLPLKPELAALAQGPDYDPNNPLYRDVGLNSLKGRLRSHLEVTARHYPKEYAQLQKQPLLTEAKV